LLASSADGALPDKPAAARHVRAVVFKQCDGNTTWSMSSHTTQVLKIVQGCLESDCRVDAFAKSSKPNAEPPDAAAPLRILGVDPGLNTTGYGVVEAIGRTLRICEAGVVRSRARRDLPSRLAEIHDGIRDVLASLKPSVMALEELYSHYDRPRTAILMGHARGVICLAAAEAGVPVLHYSATQVKRILTGSGHAPKSQIQRAIQLEFGLAQLPDPPDVADALAIALCHHYLKGKPGRKRPSA
jgi:crossover junction endodeoxyribonuclease RuvC